MQALSSHSIEELRSVRFDAWTKYHDLRSRLQENRPNVTQAQVDAAEEWLKIVDDEMKKRAR